jgi:hypothetical protein
MLNAMAKRSSGSNRGRANFSFDSNDGMTRDVLLKTEQKEKRKHSISSEATTEAYHDMLSLSRLVDDESLSRQHVNLTLSPVSRGRSRDQEVEVEVDMRGKDIHVFDDSSLSSVSVSGIIGVLEQDSLSVGGEKLGEEEEGGG